MPPNPKDRFKGNADKQVRAGEVYLEFKVIGHSVKVTAVDAATGTEVSIAGPASTDRRLLEKNALNKLKYVMSKD